MKKIRLYSKANYNNLSLISGNIASLYKEGIPIILIMDLLIEIPLNKAYKESLLKIKDYILEGKDLSESFEEFNEIYPEFFIGMLAMGEKIGNLYQVLKGLEQYYNTINYIKNTIKNLLSYPLLLFIAFISLIIFLIFFMIPNLYTFYINMNIEAPIICKVLYKFLNNIKDEKLLTIVYIISWGVALPYILYKSYFKRNLKKILLRLSLYRDFNEFIFVALLSIIVKSGVNLSNGLIYAAKSFKGNYIKERFLILNDNILSGESISYSLSKENIYSSYTKSIIKLGEESGSMEDRLNALSKYLEKKLLEKINKFMTMLQPISIMIMGVIIIIFLLIFIMPLFNSLLDGGI